MLFENGTERINWSSGASGEAESQKTYIGEYSDDESGLSYLNARYYDPEMGRFLGQDPVFILIGTDRKKLNYLLLTPQKLNSYSYTENNPVNNIDPTGGSTISAWLNHPINTFKQAAFWTGITAGLSGVMGWNVSAGFLDHSLSLNPSDLNINESNDKYGVIGDIKNSTEYKGLINQVIGKAEYNQASNIDTGRIGIEFSGGDLFGSLHGAGIDIKGQKNDNGSWNISSTLADTYNFKSGLGYNQSMAGQIGANLATGSQMSGVLSNYEVKVEFNDKK